MKVTIEGKEYSTIELSRMSGINESTIRSRIKVNPDITLENLVRKASYGHGKIRTRSGKVLSAVEAARMLGVGYRKLMSWKKDHQNKCTYEDAKEYFETHKEPDEKAMWRMVDDQDPVWLGKFSKGTESDNNHYERLCQLCGIDEQYADEFQRRYPDA